MRIIFYNRHALFLLLLILASFTQTTAAEEKYYYKVKDLRSDWKVFSEEENALVPFIESVNGKSKSIYLILNAGEYRDNGLYIHFRKKSALFANNKLIYNAEEPHSFIFSIDSLARRYGRGQLLLSVYSVGGINDLETSIVSYSEKNRSLLSGIDHLPILDRNTGPVWDFMKIGMILILILYVVLVNIGSRVFNDYYNIINSFLRAGTDEFLNRTKKITRIDLVFILVLAIVASFFIVISVFETAISEQSYVLVSIGRLFSKWLAVFLLIVVWLIIRFIVISLSSDLFKMRDVGTIHTFEYLRVTNFYSLFIFILFILTLFVIRIDLGLFINILLYSLVTISLIRAVVLYFKFLNSSDYTKLYLFAYLCSAELLPVIIGFRILLKSDLIHIVV